MKKLQNGHGEQSPRKSWWKKFVGRFVSLVWIDWLKNAHWLVKNIVRWWPACIAVPLSKWIDLEPVNEALALIV